MNIYFTQSFLFFVNINICLRQLDSGLRRQTKHTHFFSCPPRSWYDGINYILKVFFICPCLQCVLFTFLMGSWDMSMTPLNSLSSPLLLTPSLGFRFPSLLQNFSLSWCSLYILGSSYRRNLVIFKLMLFISLNYGSRCGRKYMLTSD